MISVILWGPIIMVIIMIVLLFVLKPKEHFNPNNNWEIFSIVMAAGVGVFLLRALLS
jgi:hypothetical protein